MMEIIDEKEGVVASYPYKFILKKDNDTLIGEVYAYLYENLKVDDEKKVDDELRMLDAQDNSFFYLDGGKICYYTKGIVDENNIVDSEVDIRRHFIEDFLEAEGDLANISKQYNGKTLKTEFLSGL